MADGVFFEAKSRIARAAAIPLRLCVSAVKQNTLAPSRPRGNHPITDQQLQSTAPHFRKRNRKHKRKAALRTLSPNCYLLSPVKLNAGAFSLTEVVIALGIFAVSMVGVLALFPVASSAGRESSEETQAAILAQTIFDDLRSSTSVGGANRGWIVRGPNTFNNIQWDRTIRLTNLSTTFVVYDLIPRVNSSGPDGVGMIGNPVSLKAMTTAFSASTYSNPVTTVGAIFGSRVIVEPVIPMPGLALVSVIIDTPVSVNQSNRRSYPFHSLIFAR
jgi:type II secretory pathway pseudopilin PulG